MLNKSKRYITNVNLFVAMRRFSTVCAANYSNELLKSGSGPRGVSPLELTAMRSKLNEAKKNNVPLPVILQPLESQADRNPLHMLVKARRRVTCHNTSNALTFWVKITDIRTIWRAKR